MIHITLYNRIMYVIKNMPDRAKPLHYWLLQHDKSNCFINRLKRRK